MSSPEGLSPKEWIARLRTRFQDGNRTRTQWNRCHVSQDNEGVASDPDRVALGYVPTSETFHQFSITRFEKIEKIDQRPIASSVDTDSFPADTGTMTGTESHGDRTRILAVVTPVDAITQIDSELSRETARLLQKPRETLARVDDPLGNDGASRTGVDTSAALTASISHRARIRRQLRIRQDRTENEPTSCSRQEKVGVLAVPADARSIRDFTIDEIVLVRDDSRVEPPVAENIGDVFET
jgi:hypothetical protein